MGGVGRILGVWRFGGLGVWGEGFWGFRFLGFHGYRSLGFSGFEVLRSEMRDPGLQTQVQGSEFGVRLLRSDSVLYCFYCAVGGEYWNIGKLENMCM